MYGVHITFGVFFQDWGAGDTLRSSVEGERGEWSSWSDCCVGQGKDDSSKFPEN